ncbi:GerAB/ArcD/ProY family transporter [Sporosarcina sp. Sa2YVA2]|uniref:GerAB/ArcD/ProY family transporter n=1 Tax=Sporosarcina quadrami TaxID=2762234 RepID=A0ABR8UDJ5_9BACL|nr:GerAB/ArcD/ProY family transporter [Sporosarcina quadrami]MBD7986120.1 GerAB/ArcD/ProY family transporter [Sporosarcina quadrami]
MNRFLYYLIFINMIANIIASVPRILILEKSNGAIIAMVLGTIAGLLITYITIKFYNAFPGKNLMELLKIYTPKWFSISVLIYFAANWYIAGSITLVTFTFVLIRFLTPEMPIITIAISLLIVVSSSLLIKTKSILYMIEITIVIFSPLIIFFLMKSVFNDVFEIDFVKIALMHINELPNYSAFTASTYLYIGIVNMAVFNTFFMKRIKLGILPLLILGAGGLFVISLTYFVPIGIGGFDKIDDLIYPWISTSDSIRMKFGIIERLTFFFLLVFLAIAILSISIHWHGACRLLQSALGLEKFKWKGHDLSPIFCAILFSFVSFLLILYLSEGQLFSYTTYFFNLLPVFFGISMVVFLVIKRRAAK